MTCACHRLLAASILISTSTSCRGVPDPGEHPTDVTHELERTPAAATEFVRSVDTELRKLWIASEAASWEHQTNITDENEKKASVAEEAGMAYLSATIPKAAAFAGVTGLDADIERRLRLLELATSLPAPSDPTRRKELAELSSKLSSMYGVGKHCLDESDPSSCRDLDALSEILETSRDWDELLEAWQAWRTVSPPMKPLYERFVALANQGAREIGYDDLAHLWRGGYDMPPDDFEREVDRLWEQLRPLYQQLHCHVRAQLAEQFGSERVPTAGMIPAHVTGNMWAQTWDHLYARLEPYTGQPSIDVTSALVEQAYDPVRMVRAGEAFFTSLGLDPLPNTFWERSMLTKPADREVVCHASAWDVGFDDDLRIKMCIKPTMEDLITIHHELGHNYYFHYYYELPVLFQQGANDGFHEAIGDAIALSVTPAYLEKIGLLPEASESIEAVINQQMQRALDKIAFLPFGRMIDQWRWDVFTGRVAPEHWNEHWWKLRGKYQGISAPTDRPADAFDPGAKYHIPANTPYMRYFLASILQFQFHEALCAAAGHDGPLHECSIYGSKEAGTKLKALLALGASKPWPDALEAMTGSRTMSAEPLVQYFSPLMSWLEEQNRGRTCGW